MTYFGYFAYECNNYYNDYSRKQSTWVLAERGAANAVEKLLALVQTKATVFRDGNQKEIPVEEIVPGDVIHLNAGDLIPGDSIILESKDLFVNEASLTGETGSRDRSFRDYIQCCRYLPFPSESR